MKCGQKRANAGEPRCVENSMNEDARKPEILAQNKSQRRANWR